MDPKEIALWVSLALGVVALLGHLKGWINAGEKTLADKVKDAGARVKAAEDRLESHATRILSIEGELRHLPDRDGFHRLEMRMTELTGQLNTMTERLKPVEAIGERLQELLLERAK